MRLGARACALGAALILASGPGALAQAGAEPPVAIVPAALDHSLLARTVESAAAVPRLNALIISHRGEAVVERAFRGPGLDQPVNVKSVSKTVLSALVGVAIERGVLEGVDQRVAPLLGPRVPTDADARVGDITVSHLLSMRSGLERTSGANYGRWVSSPDWVGFALSRPFVDEPGGRMLYSTGNTHVLSAALTRAARRSTLELARAYLGQPLGIAVPAWPRDPQGTYVGGNEMTLSPRALVRFGEMYRDGGVADGRRVLQTGWICASWTPQVRSPWTGDAYGYGWFITRMRGHSVYYAWGYGGQMLYVVPSLELTVAITSDPTASSVGDGYVRELHALVENGIVAAAPTRSDAAAGPVPGCPEADGAPET